MGKEGGGEQYLSPKKPLIPAANLTPVERSNSQELYFNAGDELVVQAYGNEVSIVDLNFTPEDLQTLESLPVRG